MSAPPALEARTLGKRYDSSWALRDCSLEIPSGCVTARGLHRPVQEGQSLLAAAGPGERRPEGGLHVGLTLGPARRTGQPLPLPQLGDRAWEVPVVTEDDPDRVMGQ